MEGQHDWVSASAFPWTRIICVTVLAMMAYVSNASAAPPSVAPIEILSGSHQRPWNESLVRLDVRGYTEREYSVAGTVGQDNKPYKTRILVRSPIEQKKFNGTVLVEWLNVSGGFDLDIAGTAISDLITREGYAYVGVSAQPVGVAWLRNWDRTRYGTLTHPAIPEGPLPPFILDEVLSDEIFTQIGEVVRRSDSPLAKLGIKHVIAVGQSQSAMRLTNYINAHPSAVFDGYFLLNGPGAITNTNVKVVGVNSELEVATRLARFNGDPLPIRLREMPKLDNPEAQPDAANFRLYEIAGAGHTPKVTMASVISRTTFDSPRYTADVTCSYGNAAMDDQFALQAIVSNFADWLSKGVEPPPSSHLTLKKDSKGHVEVARDEHGNSLGGIRLPSQSVPLGKNVGVNSADATTTGGPTKTMPPNLLCMTRGGFVPFDAATLKRLYPDRNAYVEHVKTAAERLVKDRQLLQVDAAAIVLAAKEAVLQ